MNNEPEVYLLIQNNNNNLDLNCLKNVILTIAAKLTKEKDLCREV